MSTRNRTGVRLFTLLRVRSAALAGLLALTALAVLAAPAQASEAIDSFESTISSQQAGGHPDLFSQLHVG